MNLREETLSPIEGASRLTIHTTHVNEATEVTFIFTAVPRLRVLAMQRKHASGKYFRCSQVHDLMYFTNADVSFIAPAIFYPKEVCDALRAFVERQKKLALETSILE